MQPGATLEQLRAINWLDYTFDPLDGFIVARGAIEVRFYYIDGYFSTFGPSTIQYYTLEHMVGRLVERASMRVKRAYISWAVEKKGIPVIWHDETSGDAIRDIHSYEIKIDGDQVRILQGLAISSTIQHLFLYTIDTLFPLPTNRPPETSREMYERLLQVEQHYKRECPFMSARYPCSFRARDIVVAGVYVQRHGDACFKQLLRWERAYALRDAITQLPQPIAEEITPHLL